MKLRKLGGPNAACDMRATVASGDCIGLSQGRENPGDAGGKMRRAKRGLRHGAVLLSALALAGCMEDQGGGSLFKPAPETQASGSPKSTRFVERDVEAPQVFQATEAGLWDGRPSLGGVWVAHPDVKDPERALIRNTANNQFVIGALFKPSLERPGPRFQVSSDAAVALGMLAGQPVNLNVTALRREEVPVKPPKAEKPAAEVPAPEKVSEAALPPAPVQDETKTASKPAETKPAASKKPEKKPAKDDPQDLAQATSAALNDSAKEETPEAEKPAKKRRFFWQKKDKATDKDEGIASLAATAAAGKPGVETTTLPGTGGNAASSAQKTAAPAASAPKPATRSAPKLTKPYLQIGIFSVEKNAKNTAVAMRQAGIIPSVLKQTSKGKTFWRVIVGPATTSQERAALLKKIKAAGFTDAYAVTN